MEKLGPGLDRALYTVAMAQHLGHVVGVLLDHGQRFGIATVRIERAGRAATDWAVEFVKPDKWRADGDPDGWVCDGETTVTTLADGTQEYTPVKSGWVPMALQPLFPLAAPVWGRSRDAWRMCESPTEDGGGLVVALESTRPPGYTGKLVVDPDHGYVERMELGAYTLVVTQFEATLPDADRLRP